MKYYYEEEKMRKNALIVCSTIVGLIILIKLGLIDALMFLILAGVVPGTHYVIPSKLMLLIIITIAGLLALSLLPIDTIRRLIMKNDEKPDTHKKRLPKRRYEQI